MKYTAQWFFYAMIGGVLLLIGAMMIVSAQPASAQCGTAASSCKNCHETQGALPVSAKGAWHSAHAFGDFCEFCHAGNVQATAKTEAHQGMVAPLGDVKTSCQGCHPTDFNELALTYASTLGITLDPGSSSQGGANPGAASSGPEGVACVGTSVSAPLGGEEIDLNLLYAEATTPPPLVSNWGNVFLALMVVGTGLAFLVTAWSWEHWGQKVAGWINQNVAPIPQAVTAAVARSEGNMALPQDLVIQRPELRHLLPQLMNLSPETLAALETVLANPERSRDILTKLSQK
jgi:hypothetical protein